MRPPDWTSEDGSVQLYCADCLDILKEMEPGSVDAVVTDPPYGIFKNINSTGWMFGRPTIYTTDKTAPMWDKRPCNEILRNLIGFNEYIIWGGNYFCDIIGTSKGVLIWDKCTGNNSFADCELAWTNVTGTTRILHHQWCGAFKDSERGLRAVHPTQKPIAVMDWCLSFIKGQTIFDPFMGSGTTGVACVRLGRKFIGVEIEPKYFEIARKRIQKAFDDQALLNYVAPEPKQAELFEETA